jgi:hypothetical protein
MSEKQKSCGASNQQVGESGDGKFSEFLSKIK